MGQVRMDTNQLSKQQILYVEDDKDLAEIISQILLGVGVVTRVTTKSEAEEKLKENSYSLVLLDLVLPDGLGVELLPKIKEMDLPVVVFSAHDLPLKYSDYVTATLIKSKTTNQKLIDTIKKVLNQKINSIKT